jgi:hypothetical protein
VDPLDCVPGHVIAGFEPGAVACECDSDPVILDAVDFEPSALGAFLASVPVSSIKMITSAWHAEASPDTNRWGERIRLADFAGATIRKCVKG